MRVFMPTGVITLLLRFVSGSWIVLIVFPQSILPTSFFPTGFAALSRIGSGRIKNVGASLTVPVGFLLGGGVIAAGIRVMGELRSFSLGLILFGSFFCWASYWLAL
jgi:NNP family nitrate/nitrite transporter-like MFS transporter